MVTINSHSLNAFFKSKTVLVTGHTGFKGAWLSIWLRELGAKVVGLSLEPPSEPNLFDSVLLKSMIQSHIGDVKDFLQVKEIVDVTEPEIVFHLAAQSLVRPSYRDPLNTYATNVMGTVNILEACRQSDYVRSVVLVTSDKCYQNKNWLWGYRENDALGGKDPYSSSKACAELVADGYRSAFFQNTDQNRGVVTVRAGNVIGGGDWATDRIIPDCIKALQAERSILLRNPDAIRPWQHVVEPLYGYLMLASALYAEPEKYSGGWNFGPEMQSCVCVREVVEAIIENWGGGKWKDVSDPSMVHEAATLRIDSSKSKTMLHWHPRWNYKQAVNQTVHWYQQYHSGKNMYDLCCEQIRHYMENRDGV